MTARICRVHDADDVIEGRICGRPLPCPEHPSDWRSQPRAKRARPGVQLTLSREAIAVLERMAGPAGSKSAVVERWLLDHVKPR
jgi:hypothetical protein